MNLNFYNPTTMGSLENLQSTLQDQINKLDQIRNMGIGAQAQKPQEQRYYLDCGNKEDWTQFLKLNYNLTEKQIFDDYKLFLQAKAELSEDDNKEKLEAMKQKIKTPKEGKINELSNNSIEHYVQPVNTSQQYIQQPNTIIQPSQSISGIQSNYPNPTNQCIQSNLSTQVNASDIATSVGESTGQRNYHKMGKYPTNNEGKGAKHVR